MTTFFVTLNLRYRPHTFSRSIHCYNRRIHQARKRKKSPDLAFAGEAALYMNEHAQGVSIGELLEGCT
jgi:hypothetical protein